jgi:hypothetical protein
MGQIIIDVPMRGVKRRYRLDDVEKAAELLNDLQAKAQRVKVNSEKLTAEDAADIRAARRARKGEFVDWEDAKAFLDRLN